MPKIIARNNVVRTRIDDDTKLRATKVLAKMGLSVSEALRDFMGYVAEKQCLPFDKKIPNAKTRKAMAELESGKGHKTKTLDELFSDLGI